MKRKCFWLDQNMKLKFYKLWLDQNMKRNLNQIFSLAADLAESTHVVFIKPVLRTGASCCKACGASSVRRVQGVKASCVRHCLPPHSNARLNKQLTSYVFTALTYCLDCICPTREIHQDNIVPRYAPNNQQKSTALQHLDLSEIAEEYGTPYQLYDEVNLQTCP